jgi:hypothetical protein
MDALFSFGGMLLLFGFIAGTGIWLGMRRVARAGEQLRRLGERTGLTFEQKPKTLGVFAQTPELHGTRRGKYLRVYAYTTGSGKSRAHWTAVAARLGTSSALTFRLSREGLGSRILSVFGAKEIQVGDAEFDRRWFVQTNAPDFFRAALLPELRTKLDAISRRGGDGIYETVNDTIRYSERGWFADQARCERFVDVIDAVCDLADVAEVHGPSATIR